MHTIRLLIGWIKQDFVRWLSQRGFTLTLVANQAITPLIGLAVWTSAVPNQNLSAYYIALMVVRLCVVSYEHHTFSGRIYEGELADDLLQPHPVVFRPLSVNLAIRANHLLIGLPLLIGALLFTPARFDVALVVTALPALVLAGVLNFLFTYALSMSAFWTERAHGVVGIGATLTFLLGGEAAPIRFLPEAIQPFGEALPFRAMLGFPAEIAAGTLSQSQIIAGYGWQVMWVCAFAFIVLQVWRAGLRRFAAIGG
jgi:ABC-2 type transport system permease protein